MFIQSLWRYYLFLIHLYFKFTDIQKFLVCSDSWAVFHDWWLENVQKFVDCIFMESCNVAQQSMPISNSAIRWKLLFILSALKMKEFCCVNKILPLNIHSPVAIFFFINNSSVKKKCDTYWNLKVKRELYIYTFKDGIQVLLWCPNSDNPMLIS